MGADAGLTYAKATDTLTAGTFTTSGASPTLTAADALAITTTASNGSITITPHGSGDIILDGQKWPQTDGTANQILKTNGAGQLSWTADAGGIALTDLSVTTGSASGAGTLAYNNGTGVFTFQPADLSTYLTSTGVLSSHTDVHTAAPSTNDVLTWTASQSRWEPAAPQFTGFFGLTEEVVDTAADKIAFLDADNVTKKESIADFLTAIAGTNLTAASGQLNASGGGGGGNAFETIAVSGQGNVVADSSTDTLTFVAGTGITLATNAGTDSITINASGGAGSQNLFETIAVSGQTDVVADTTTDTLTLVAGSNMTITTSFPDTITFASAGGGGSSSETFTVNYAAGGTSISSISNLPSGWSSSINGNNVTITHTAGGQPMGVSFYGLDKSASPDVWKYGYPTSTYPLTFPDSSETISTTEFTLNIGTAATGANTGTPFATSKAHIKVIF